MADENDDFSFPQQESYSSEAISEKEYLKALCLHQRQTFKEQNTRENAVSSIINDGLNGESLHQLCSNYRKNHIKVSSEHDDCSKICEESKKNEICEHDGNRTFKNGENNNYLSSPKGNVNTDVKTSFPQQYKKQPQEKSFDGEQYKDGEFETQGISEYDCVPEALEEITEIHKPQEPQEIPQPREQILKELLHKFLQKPTYENVREDNIVQGDCIESNGMFGKLYKHFALVESVDGDKITVTEYSLKDGNKLLLGLKTIAMTLALHDPLAMLAKAKLSTYTLQQLEARNAKKIIFPEELQRYINTDKTLKNTEKRRKEPDCLYSLSTNNCEHLVWWCLFDLDYSYQANETHERYLYVLKGVSPASRLLSVMNWPYLYVFNELCLAGYYSYQAHHLKK